MASESGDMKVLGNFSKLIELVSIDPNYNPANTKLKVPALTTQNNAALAATGDVRTKDAPYKAAVNDRQEIYDVMRPVVTRSGNMLQASGASTKIRADAKTFSRKITGTPKSTKTQTDPNALEGEGSKTHSTSQKSYENILGNFEAYIEIVATVTSYAPNETELTIDGLRALASDIRAKNEAVNNTFAPLSAARGLRDQLLYTNDDSVVNIALLVKAYVRAALGPDSQTYKQIKGLEFKKRNR